MFHQPGANMIALKKQPDLDEISQPEKSLRPPMVKFKVFGEEMIEKEVKPSGNSGRIYLPLDWVGKHVKVIRID